MRGWKQRTTHFPCKFDLLKQNFYSILYNCNIYCSYKLPSLLYIIIHFLHDIHSIKKWFLYLADNKKPNKHTPEHQFSKHVNHLSRSLSICHPLEKLMANISSTHTEPLLLQAWKWGLETSEGSIPVTYQEEHLPPAQNMSIVYFIY